MSTVDQVVEIVKKNYNELAKTGKFKTTEKAHRFKMTVLRYSDAKNGSDPIDNVHAVRIALEFREFKLKQFIKNENDLKIVQDWVDSILNSFDNAKAEKIFKDNGLW